MASMPTFGHPPTGYGWSDRASDLSALSTTTAFHRETELMDQRDQFLGICRCVICGVASESLEHCHVIMYSESHIWRHLKTRGWIPSLANLKTLQPRNGMIMCKTHHRQFDSYVFFIRFFPDILKFVFINYSGDECLQQFHGKAIALDIKDIYAPFPSLFIIHEMCVRGSYAFQPVAPTVPNDILWQDWISSGQVFDNASNSFRRDSPPNDNDRSVEVQLPFHPMTTAPSGERTLLALNADVIADILAATRAMLSWKASEGESTSWTGTAEENIQKYISSIGAQLEDG